VLLNKEADRTLFYAFTPKFYVLEMEDGRWLRNYQLHNYNP